MTWKEFKDKLVEQGVRDDTLIDYIDMSSFNPADLEITITSIGDTDSEVSVHN